MAERASDRERMLHVSGPGSHRYSSSVRSARLGRTWLSQWKVSCSSTSLVEFMAPVYDPFPDTYCQLSGSSFGRAVPGEIGRAVVCTPVNNLHLVLRVVLQ